MLLKPDTSELPLIIGFDAEWVEEPEEPGDDPEADDPRDPETLPGNRVLSYQYACRFSGREWSGIIYTRVGAELRWPDLSAAEAASYPERWRFADMLAEAIRVGTKSGYLRKWPKSVIAAAHWTRADLAAMADYKAIKDHFDGVQKTYVTLGGLPYKARVSVGNRPRSFEVELLDTMLLAPGTVRSLDAIGKLYGFEKLDPGHAFGRGPYIKHMDWLLTDNPAHYEAYAIKDAQICALHVERMLAFARDELGLDIGRLPVTLGTLAVRFLESQWERAGIDPGAVGGYEMLRQTRFNRNTGRGYLTKPERWPMVRYSLHEPLAKLTFHGGRNECFWYGPTADMCPAADVSPYAQMFKRWDFATGRAELAPVLWREFDLAGAYATALSSLCIPDYKAARPTTDPTDFGANQLGFARVAFRFPPTTRFPCLPVVASDERGLIYPLAGESCCTAPEIELARHLGAEIEVLDGVVIPWIANSPRPFELVIGELTRRRAEHDKGTLHNEMFKQLGNSLYGKLGQGIKGTTVYNTRSDRREVIGPCSITNPYLAAHVTGLIRALVSELIASIPDRWNVVSVTTDGFITNAPMMDIAMTGPVASHMLLVRMGLVRSETASAELIEEKFAVAQVLPWRTRGIATLRKATEEPGGKSKLARGGMREPHGTSDPNAWFVWVALNREPGTKYRVSEPLAFPVAHRKAADHRFQVREKTFNFEYDMKRRPVDPVPQYVTVPGPGWAAGLEPDVYIAQHLAFNTIPWATVAEFTEVRDQFEQWRLKHQGQLRTIADWRRWEDFRAGAGASRHGVRRGRGGVVGQVVRIFQCAYVHRVWGMHGGDYKRAAEALTKAGYPTTEQSFKNALRNKAAPEHAIPADAPGIRELIQVLVSIWPEFQWRRMVKGAGPGYLRQNTPEPHLERARERQKT